MPLHTTEPTIEYDFPVSKLLPVMKELGLDNLALTTKKGHTIHLGYAGRNIDHGHDYHVITVQETLGGFVPFVLVNPNNQALEPDAINSKNIGGTPIISVSTSDEFFFGRFWKGKIRLYPYPYLHHQD